MDSRVPFIRTAPCPCYGCSDRSWDCKLNKSCALYETWKAEVRKNNDMIYKKKNYDRISNAYTFDTIRRLKEGRRKP